MTTTIERSIDVDVPASTAYNAWTQFEQFPDFMRGVEEVRQFGKRRLAWRAGVFGKTEEWVAEITEQIPDKRIAWRSESGARNAGVVTFHRLSDDEARVTLQLEYEPEGLSEKIGDALGLVKRRVAGDLGRFKEFVESRPAPVPGWRGSIDSQPDAAQR